jgi:hypothetical protein
MIITCVFSTQTSIDSMKNVLELERGDREVVGEEGGYFQECGEIFCIYFILLT